ncbi:MAG: ABC transporter permease [Firmicutes bacterium]|nr:ABC transporter permease [Bacillota bacterium]
MRLWRLLRSAPALPGYLLLTGAIIINILVQGPDFFSMDNFNSIFSVNAPLIMAAIAQTVVVLTGEIDLSIGSNMTLVNTIAILLANQYHWPVGGSWLTALLAGTLVGVLNGLIVAYLRIPSLLATFSTMSVVSGLALWVLPKPGGTVPSEVYSAYGGYLVGLPTTVWIIATVVALWAIISKYPIGKYIRAVGGRERSAYASGIRIERVKLFAHTFSGFVTGLAGLCLTALMASGDPKIGLPFGLNSIAAVILGGTILSGGWGGIGGSIAGALFLGLVSNIVFFLFNNFAGLIPGIGNVSSFYQQLLSNLIVIFGLASAVFTPRKKNGIGLPKTREGMTKDAV